MRSAPPTFTFIIDTEQYAGGFERPLCAYVTGQIGECGVGQDMAEIAQRELPEDARAWFEECVRHEPDDNGCSRPVEIVPTPGWFNSGPGCHFRDGTDLAVVRAANLEAVRASEKSTLRAYEKWVAEGDATQQAGLNAVRERIARAERGEFDRYPAYLSVGILLDEEPPPQIADLMRERALKFAALWPTRRESIVITGFRLVRTTVVHEVVWAVPAQAPDL